MDWLFEFVDNFDTPHKKAAIVLHLIICVLTVGRLLGERGNLRDRYPASPSREKTVYIVERQVFYGLLMLFWPLPSFLLWNVIPEWIWPALTIVCMVGGWKYPDK